MAAATVIAVFSLFGFYGSRILSPGSSSTCSPSGKIKVAVVFAGIDTVRPFVAYATGQMVVQRRVG